MPTKTHHNQHYFAGVSHLKDRNWQEAEKEFLIAAEKDPNTKIPYFIGAIYELGNLHQKGNLGSRSNKDTAYYYYEMGASYNTSVQSVPISWCCFNAGRMAKEKFLATKDPSWADTAEQLIYKALQLGYVCPRYGVDGMKAYLRQIGRPYDAERAKDLAVNLTRETTQKKSKFKELPEL